MDINGKKLRVGFQYLNIEIKDADFRTDNLTDCYGHYLQRENKIQINTNLEPHDLLNTVIHECLHACAYVGGLTTKSSLGVSSAMINISNLFHQPLKKFCRPPHSFLF